MNLLTKIKEFCRDNWSYLAIAVIMFFTGFAASILYKSSYSGILSSSLNEYNNGKCIVKVDNFDIGEDYIKKRVKLYKRYISPDTTDADPVIEDKILRKLIDNYIVLDAACRSDIFSGKRAEEYLWLYLEEAMVNYYLDFMVNIKRETRIKLSDKEVEDFYVKNKALFDKKNVKKREALLIIRRQLNAINEKLDKKNRFIARKIELGRLKRDRKIIFNND